MKKKRSSSTRIIFVMGLMAVAPAWAQVNNKISFFGSARALFVQSQVSGEEVKDDTTNASQANFGHTLIDLGINIKPNREHQVCAILRARNEFGGFYGQGATVKIRQLYATGTIAKVLGYKVGDLDLKQSRFTLWNYKEENNLHETALFSRLREVIYYENFYLPENTWRMQGGELNLNLASSNGKNRYRVETFAVRNRIATNFIIPEELIAGASLKFNREQRVQSGINYINTFTIANTSTTGNWSKNPVLTGNVGFAWMNSEKWSGSLNLEAGHSELVFSEIDSIRSGKLLELGLNLKSKTSGLFFDVSFRSVSPQFFSAGAQTKRINVRSSNVLFPYLGNASSQRRATILDYTLDPALYNRGISLGLMQYNPVLNNTFAYGDATPNRRGLIVSTGLLNDTSAIGFHLTSAAMTDIAGQGVAVHTRYYYSNLIAQLNLRKLIGIKNNFLLKAGIQSDLARRDADSVSSVNFSSLQADLGAELELFKKLDLLFGFKMANGTGREFIVRYNDYNAIEDYVRIDFDQKNRIVAYGVSYRFTHFMHLSLIGQQASVRDGNSALEYNMSRYFILYNLTF